MAERGQPGTAAWEGELFRLLAENVADYANFIVGQDRRVLSWSKGAERLLGYREEQIIGQSADCFFTPEDRRDGIPEKEVEQALATGRGEDDRWHVRRDGTRFWSNGVMTPLRDAGGELRGLAKIMRDRIELKQGEARRAARFAVTQVLAQAATLREAVPCILEAVGETLGWDAGTFWTLDPEAGVLRCLEVWHSPSADVAEFEAASRQRTFPAGVGLPGRVWRDRKPVWVPDVTTDSNFPRAPIADRAGLHGAFACPVRLQDDFLGVIEFFSRAIREPDADLLEMMATIGGQVGQFMERRRAESVLRESEERFARFMQHLPGLAWIKDSHGRYVFANDAAVTAFRTPRAELYGKTDEEIFPPATATQFRENDRRALVGGTGVQVIETLVHEDGTPHYSVVSKFPIPGSDGQVALVGGMAIDVTDRRRAEAEARFRAQLLDAVDQAAIATDPDGRITYLNRFAEALYGWPRGEAVGRSILEVVVAPEGQRQAAEVMDRLRAGQNWSGECPVRRRDGTTFPAFVTDTPVFDGEGRLTAIIGISTDVTERKRTEQTLRFLAEVSASLASLVDYESTLQKVARLAVPCFADWCAVDIAGDDGSLRRLAVAHVDPAKVELARELDRRYPPDPRATRGALHVLRTGRSEMLSDIPDAMLVEAARDDDHLRILRELGLRSYLCVPLRARGQTLGVLTFVAAESARRYGPDDLVVAEDLAHRAAVAIDNARLYQEVREADRRKDEFLAILAHELRNPLAPIRNAVQILKLPGVDRPTAEQAREMMERQLHNLVRLVDDLLDVSRIVRGKIELRSEPVQLQAVVARAVETAQPLIESQGHQLSVTVPPAPVWLEADPVRLTQVVANLLNNAAKYTERAGRIWLTAARGSGEVSITVRDSGIGIAPAMLPRVFDMFVQVERSSDHRHAGLGIGLTLVRSLVEMHGGTVEARSDGPGRGSEFVVRLPDRPTPGGAGAPAVTAPAPPSDRHRILVVDDNEDAAESLAMLLRLEGHDVRVAFSGPAALQALRTERPDMMFLDLGMPGMDGYEVCRQLRQTPNLQSVFVAALTGWGQPEDRRRTREAGFDHHMTKPVEPSALQALLAGLRSAKG